MTPLPFLWPYWPIFWGVFVWAYMPEFGIVRRGQKAATSPDSKDAGSIKVIMGGGALAMFGAFPLARVAAFRFPAAWQIAIFAIGTLTVIAASLLRRHCFRQLGTSFTGDVRARPDQVVVQTGAYSLVRHPSYTAGILLNVGIGVALGSWASTLLLTVAAVAVYLYRIAVEERTLLAIIGDPYREYMRTHPRRLIPFVY